MASQLPAQIPGLAQIADFPVTLKLWLGLQEFQKAWSRQNIQFLTLPLGFQGGENVVRRLEFLCVGVYVSLCYLSSIYHLSAYLSIIYLSKLCIYPSIYYYFFLYYLSRCINQPLFLSLSMSIAVSIHLSCHLFHLLSIIYVYVYLSIIYPSVYFYL